MRQVFHGNIRGIYCVGCSSAPRVLGALQPQEFTLNTDTYTHRKGRSEHAALQGGMAKASHFPCLY